MPASTRVPVWPLYYSGLLAVLWVFLWLLFGDALLPRGTGFGLFVLYLLARGCGDLVKRASRRLPPLLGMLLALSNARKAIALIGDCCAVARAASRKATDPIGRVKARFGADTAARPG